jgi:hypothetical protein
MAIVTQAVQEPSDAGITPTDIHATVAAQNGIPSGNLRTLLIITTNSTAGGIHVTLPFFDTVDGVTPAAKSIAIAASSTKIIGPFTADHNTTDPSGAPVVEFDVDTPANISTCWAIAVP